MRAPEIVTALRRHYGAERDGIGPEWAALDEVELTGPGTRRIDLLLVRAWSGRPKGHERHAVEVKVSRADLRRELDSGKWRPWAAVAHRFYLAVPDSLNLDGLDLPDTWGIYTVTSSGVRQTRRAKRHDDPAELPHRLVVEAFRRASRAEARIREAAAGDTAAELADARAQLAALTRKLDTAYGATERERDRVRAALDLAASIMPDGVVCRCGTEVKLTRRRGRGSRPAWEHVGEAGTDPRRYAREGEVCRYAAPDLDALVPEVDDEPEGLTA